MTTGRASFAIRSAPAWRMLRNVLMAAAAIALVAWAWAVVGQGEAARAWLALPFLLPIVGAAGWRGETHGRLVLDGGAWCFEAAAADPAPQAGELVVAVDLGDWMLLRFRPDGVLWPRNRRWFALSRSDMPADWQAFRRAVYSPRPSPAGLSAQAPAAPPA